MAKMYKSNMNSQLYRTKLSLALYHLRLQLHAETTAILNMKKNADNSLDRQGINSNVREQKITSG